MTLMSSLKFKSGTSRAFSLKLEDLMEQALNLVIANPIMEFMGQSEQK
jgi:hypothetical protein